MDKTISADVWTDNIFAFIEGNELFRSMRLVSKTWNARVLSTGCDIQVYFPNVESNDRNQRGRLLLAQARRVEEFITCGKKGLFKSVSGVTFKSNIRQAFFFEGIFNLDWPNLKSLNMNDTGMNSEGVKFLANGGMKNLTSLNLANNTIGDEGVKHLCKSSNVKGLTSLKIFGNQIGYEGAQYLLSENLRGLTELNSQTLSNAADNHYFALIDHFCGETPFKIHTFDNAADLKEFLITFYLDYWQGYAGEILDLSGDDEPNVEVLREKIIPLPIGRVAGWAVGDVGGLVFNESETEAVVAIVYGQKVNAKNFEIPNAMIQPYLLLLKKVVFMLNNASM